eukprot:scaffold1034_cov127-Cylindrotheca_fusiformis.AAC.2
MASKSKRDWDYPDSREAKRHRNGGRGRSLSSRSPNEQDDGRDKKFRNGSRSSTRRRDEGDWNRRRRSTSRSNDRGDPAIVTIPLKKEPEDLNVNENGLEDACFYICDLPENVTKNALVRFIQSNYKQRRDIDADVTACTIRHDKYDACVKLRDPYHVRDAEDVLDRTMFDGFEVRVPRWELRYLNMFKMEAYSAVKVDEDEIKPEEEDPELEKAPGIALAPNDPPAASSDESSPVRYFKEQQQATKSIYIYNLPDKLKPGDLKKAIVHHCKGVDKPEFTVVYLRSQKNDACVEFNTIKQSNVAVDRLDYREIKSQQIRATSWNIRLAESFIRYYQEKENRKKQKETGSQKTAEILRLANEKLQGEKIAEENERLNQQIATLKADTEHLRSNLATMTREHQKVKKVCDQMFEENEGLKKSLQLKDQENRHTLDQLKEERDSKTKLQQQLNEKEEKYVKEIADLKKELLQFHQRLAAEKEQSARDREGWQAQQEELHAKQQKIDDVKNELGASTITLAKEKKKTRALEKEIKTKQLKVEHLRGQLSGNEVKDESTAAETLQQTILKSEPVKSEPLKSDVELFDI